ncbi:MAG: orotidine-5'-phosphate decarboxylase, partial [Actinobacteria bacterium]|nr:orotidine-5'-phosphate decarboxylase [Actinomycetota bacterium]NIS31121.1 orotidine-5'-phosphate decarboxylase [Actinomycetota bacterium]NIV57223.1 orotidine-5'-phosphate decarboxylase [Actinomycetota bacterium]NIX22811.1 orotidine-5'-phosphate decarboxylase [Actinomycetota bacterium]
ERVAGTGSVVCVGLDPRTGDAVEARDRCLDLITATAADAAAYKPNSAFFEVFGAAGLEALAEVIAAVPDEIPVILDAKRGDIASTAEA